MPLSLSHSLSSLKLTLSTLVSLSQLRSPTHEACRRSECLTGKPMELATDWSACLWILVLSHRQWLYHAADLRFGIFFFFLLWIVGGGDSHLSSSLSQLRSPTHEARRRLECLTVKPMELAADRSACLWILVLSRCQWLFCFFFWFFYFLLCTGGGGVDGVCGCDCVCI